MIENLSVNIELDFVSKFGTKGTGNSQFSFASGSVIANDNLYVVDKQNNRIQYFDLDGSYVGQFGSNGTGNDNFSFPEQITTDGTHLYITDAANHRIKKHTFTGVFVSEFGTRGSGDLEFDYPTGIFYFNNLLFITDKQNSRIKAHETNGTLSFEFDGVFFPEGITIIEDINEDNLIVVADTGNKEIKFFDITGNFLYNSFGVDFERPLTISDNNNVLSICDAQANKIIYIDYFGVFIDSKKEDFFFPTFTSFDANTDKYYVVDSANFQIQIFNLLIEEDIPEYSDDFLQLSKQLYPTGRSWWMPFEGVFNNFHLGLAYSESRANTAIRSILNSILPDNDNFTTTDATNWERTLGLQNGGSLTIDERKVIISRKMKYPGGVKGRQSAVYIEGELRKAGFDVYVHENLGTPPINPVPSNYGGANYGGANYGNTGLSNYTLIANYIDEDKDRNYILGQNGLLYSFFIGGENFGERAQVDPLRKKEFRELILKLKPAHTIGFLNIDYTIEAPNIQCLFDEIGGIDFDTNIGIDSTSGFDVNLTGINGITITGSQNLLFSPFISFVNNFTLIFETDILDVGKSILLRGQSGSSLRFRWEIEDRDKLILFLNNIEVLNTSITEITAGIHIFGLTYSDTTDDFKFYVDGQPIHTHNDTPVSISAYLNRDLINLNCLAFLKTELTPAEMLSVTSENEIRQICIDNNTVSEYYPLAELEGAFYDEITGAPTLQHTGIRVFIPNKTLTYLKYGFELYTDDLTGLIRKYVSLKFDGTALNPTIPDFSSQGIIAQENGYQFLNNNIVFTQPDEVILKALDTFLVYYTAGGVAKEIDFAYILALLQGGTVPYLSADFTETKIENLKFLLI